MKSLLLAVALTNPIIFVTQVPVPGDFTTVASTFGNHLPSVAEAPRGGDLWIRYPDGTLKNLTALCNRRSPWVRQSGLAAMLFRRADANINGRVSAAEWQKLFKQADRGFIIFLDEGTQRLIPKVIKTRRPQAEAA